MFQNFPITFLSDHWSYGGLPSLPKVASVSTAPYSVPITVGSYFLKSLAFVTLKQNFSKAFGIVSLEAQTVKNLLPMWEIRV